MRTLVRGVLALGQGVVLDPFCGAGSTLAAAESVGYESVGIEKGPAQVSRIQERQKSSIELVNPALPQLLCATLMQRGCPGT
jgi:hypothetical protein